MTLPCDIRRRLGTLCCATALLLAAADGAAAQLMTGHRLAELARAFRVEAAGQGDENIRRDSLEFVSFVRGVHAMASRWRVICGSENLSKNRLGFVVSDFLERIPYKWDEPADMIVLAALGRAYPCRKDG